MGSGEDVVNCSLADFERIELIGSGGNADVHRARVTVGGRQHEVALKTPRMANYETVDTAFFEEFAHEAEIWSQIDDHESIVGVFDWGREPYPWIALEYMDAGNLDQRAGDLSVAQRVEVFERICDAVFHAHRHGVSHGDLKPENILLTHEAGGVTAKVADWGLANVLLEHSRSADGLTIAYSAPEQIDPETYGDPDDRTDIYQLGVIAYELFTGRTPFEAGTTAEMVAAILNEDPPLPSAATPGVTEAFDEAVATALAKRKADRYEAVPYLRDAVVRSLSGRTEEPADGNGTSRATDSGPRPEPIEHRSVGERDDRSTETESTAPDDSAGTATSDSESKSTDASARSSPDRRSLAEILSGGGVRHLENAGRALRERGDIAQFYSAVLDEPFRIRGRDHEREFVAREPETAVETVAFTGWKAVAALVVVLLYPLTLLGAIRFDEQRITASLRETSIPGALALSVICWGGLAVLVNSQLSLPADEANAIIGACFIAIFSAIAALTSVRIPRRTVAVFLSYPFALTAIFLPPVVAVLLSEQLPPSSVPYSEQIAVFIQDDVLARVGLKDYFVRNFDRDGGAYVIMWILISVPIGWLLGIMVTLADFIRPKGTGDDEE